MRNCFKLTILIFLSICFVQCQSDDITVTPIDDPTIDPIVTVFDTIDIYDPINTNQTWTSGNTYILHDLISVTDNATLTIEPGVLVKAMAGATGLVITKGAKIDAQGSAEQPIIFTAFEDMIQPGEILSPNLTSSDVKLWSGIFMLGCAPVSSRTTPAKFSRLPDNPLFQYGGDVPTDNSGTLNYVSIRHTGYEISDDETPSGLNLGAVGNGTSISNVELLGNEDDALVLDGGTVNLQNVVSVFFMDDGIDCDRGWSGNIDNVIGVGADVFGAAIEVDGGEGTTNPSFTISNASFGGNLSGEAYIYFRAGVNCLIENVYFFNFDQAAEVKLRRDEDANNWINGQIDVTNLEFNTSHLSAGNTTIAQIFVDYGNDGSDAFSVRTPDASIVTTPTTGADKSVFAAWTVADLTGDLDDF